ncbi:glycosyltransferase family 4 protein [Candidatus Margulisiibacteriota bacterium]
MTGKNICIISGIFHPEQGGPATYLYNLSNDLAKKGHQLQVIAYGDQKKLVEDDISYPYSVTRISRNIPVIIRLLLFIKTIIKKAKKADLLYVNDYGLPAVLANFFLRKPIVMKIVGDFAWEYSVRKKFTKKDIDSFQKQKGLRINFMKALQRFYVKKALKIITPSNYLKQIITGWNIAPDKILIINNAINYAEYLKKIGKENLQDQYRLKGYKVLITVARLAPWKGVDKTIEVLGALKRSDPTLKIKYIVIGAGDDLYRLKKIVAKHNLANEILFLGKLPHPEVKKYLDISDIFTLYSGYEGLPHVILEAMAAGLPVVVSDKGGTKELIKNGVNGFVVSVENTKEYQEKLLHLLQDEKLCHDFSVQNLEDIKKYSWQNLLNTTEKVLKEHI